jgi:hypothetical protein
MLSSDPFPGWKPGYHAVVVGASMAGLLAARVLQEHFEQVTVVDKDPEQGMPHPRKGVPQGEHGHVLLVGGASVLAELFSGLFVDLIKHGSVVINMAAGEFRWFYYGDWKLDPNTEIILYSQTRPFLEWQVRRRLVS